MLVASRVGRLIQKFQSTCDLRWIEISARFRPERGSQGIAQDVARRSCIFDGL